LLHRLLFAEKEILRFAQNDSNVSADLREAITL